MNVDQFLAEVKDLVDLGNDEEAEKATRATLEALRERLAGNEPSNLAAQLPPEIASYVEGSGGQGSFDLAEFYRRVAHKRRRRPRRGGQARAGRGHGPANSRDRRRARPRALPAWERI